MLKGKNAIITGCNRGIGKAILTLFAESGADIWACLRCQDAEFSSYAKALAENNGVTIKEIYFDLSDTDEIKAAARQITADKLPIDILINNAGAIETAAFLMTSMDTMREMFELNFFSHMQFTQTIARQMLRKRKGSIINLSSSAAIEGNEGRTAYAAAKAAIITASKVMARELGPAGIRVNVIAPGLTQTDMMENSTPADALLATVDRLSLKRVGQPHEIAGAALFLASDLSSYMTGQVLSIDGGM